MSTHVVARSELDLLLELLASDGYEVVGPTVRDGAIIYDHIGSTRDLPVGWTDQQDGGKYRLSRRDDEALFGYNVGPSSWKTFLFPPRLELFRVEQNGNGTRFLLNDVESPRRALFGVKSCELAAIAIQDKVFLASGHVDANYAARRENLFIVAVDCGTASGSCFCVSMDTGPGCESGFDLRITEIVSGDGFEYLIQSGTPEGASLADRLAARSADDTHIEARDAALDNARSEMGLSMDTEGLRDLMVDGFDHPRWQEVADRCLTCGNCTLVCPTCFCSTATDSVTLDGVASRTRVWDSCFSLDFTGLHGHPVRSSAKSRYRQWMTHKLATWQDQFGTMGCVGCGRCITWCPVGIDITAEVRAMREEVSV
ncbi:MAG: 4Fe-4S dicluster domain-containing protein [Actinomycetota bacterium]|nr:4Fe-4S dicluster domain-containing protein [Actinomycetota bacterium]